jgi:hypothetical protein
MKNYRKKIEDYYLEMFIGVIDRKESLKFKEALKEAIANDKDKENLEFYKMTLVKLNNYIKGNAKRINFC